MPYDQDYTPPDPTKVAGDTTLPDTSADRSGGALSMLVGFLRLLFYRFLPAWFVPPPGYRAYDVQGTIGTPVVGAIGTVLELPVPIGFDTCVRGLSVNIIGPGFVQGAGQLVFSVTVDNAPVKGYGSILTELGSPQQFRPSFGILAQAGQVVRIIVRNAAYIAAGTNVTGSLVGYHYTAQRRRGGRAG